MRHLLTGIAVTSTLIAACGGPAAEPDTGVAMVDAFMPPGTDAGPRPDAFVRTPDAFMAMGEDAPMMMGEDAPMMMGEDAPMMMGEDAPTMETPDAAMMMMLPDAPMAMLDAPVIDAGFMGDAFTPPPPNDICNTAIVVTSGMTTGSTRGAANDYGNGMNCDGTDGLDIVYAIDVPAGQTVTVTVASGDGTFDPSINLVAGPAASCGGSPRACLDGDDSGSASTTNAATWTNTTAASVRVFAVVDNFDDMDTGGAFNMEVTVAAPAMNDTCASALAITPGTVRGSTTGTMNDYGMGMGCVGTAGADVVYALTVPAGQRAVVTATTGGGGFDPSINLVAGPAATCGGTPRTCLAGDDTGTASAVNRTVWLNTTGATATIYAVVDSGSAMATGPFVLTYALETPPAGDTCGTAVRVTPGTVMSSTASHANDLGAGMRCTGAGGIDRIYVASVGPGQTLTATVTSGDGTFDPSINLELMCGSAPRVCLDGDDTGAASALNMVTHMNTGAAAQDVFISIESANATATGPFTMTVALAP